jgi:hypothetical protein
MDVDATQQAHAARSVVPPPKPAAELPRPVAALRHDVPGSTPQDFTSIVEEEETFSTFSALEKGKQKEVVASSVSTSTATATAAAFTGRYQEDEEDEPMPVLNLESDTDEDDEVEEEEDEEQ